MRKLESVSVARLLAVMLAVLACGSPAGAPVPPPGATTSGIALVVTTGTFRLPAASAFGEPGFHEAVMINTKVPVAPAPGAGRQVVIRLRDSSRPRTTCGEDHPLSGCATVDWSDSTDRPKVPPSGVFDNSLVLSLAGGPMTLFLRAGGALADSPAPFVPG